MNRRPLDVLIVGAGMYVCGRGADGYGTILPSVMQAARDGLVDRIVVAGTKASSITFLRDRVKRINHQLGTQVDVEGFPKKGEDPQAYRTAMNRLGPRGCVIVAVPDHLHYAIARDALISNRPVLIVKPLTPTVEEGQELVRLARSRNLYGAVEFHKRWDLANRKLHGLIQEDRLGRPLYALIEFSQRKRVPQEVFGNWVERTNVFQYLGVHYVDLLRHIFDATPQRVMALGQFAYLKHHSRNTQDAIQAMVEWTVPGSDTPFVSTFLVNWVDPNTSSAMSYQSIKVVGTRGRYESDQKCRGQQLVTDEGGIEDINPYFTQAYPAGPGGRMEYLGYGIESVRTFLEDVRKVCDADVTVEELEGLRPTLRQALVSTAVSEAVGQSLCSGGQWVPVKNFALRF